MAKHRFKKGNDFGTRKFKTKRKVKAKLVPLEKLEQGEIDLKDYTFPSDMTAIEFIKKFNALMYTKFFERVMKLNNEKFCFFVSKLLTEQARIETEKANHEQKILSMFLDKFDFENEGDVMSMLNTLKK